MDINKLIESWHPKLIGTNYKIISSSFDIQNYNCIAYVLDIFDIWCGPATNFWPYETLPRSVKLDNYIKYFELYDYDVCENDSYEIGFTKIALYIDKYNFVNHAAKQFKNSWRSKLGTSYVIEHKLDWISGDDFSNYGRIGVIMKKKI